MISTPSISQEGDYSFSLIIQLTTQKIAICLCDCRIFYRISIFYIFLITKNSQNFLGSTPEFIQLTPRSASIGDTITITGYPKTALASNVDIKIGNINCDRLDVDEKGDNDRSINTWSSYSFTCKIPSDVIAGKTPLYK